MQLTGLSVWRIEPNNPQPTGFGVLDATELDENPDAVKLCDEFIDNLWDKDIDRTDTRVHTFETDPSVVDHVSQVKRALFAIAWTIDFAENCMKIATWISEKKYAQRYVLLIMSFIRSGKKFTALVLTESAKDETFLITKDKLVSELDNIFKRFIYKGVIYPYYDWYKEDVCDDKAKVFQSSAAQYILDALGLVVQATPSQMVSEALRYLSRNPLPTRDLASLGEEIISAAAFTRDEPVDNVTGAISGAPITIQVDSVKLQARVQDLSHHVSITGSPGQYTVTIRGESIDIRSGNQHVDLEDLFGG